MEETTKPVDVKVEDNNIYHKLWYIESVKNGEDYQIKKVSEHKIEVIGHNPNTNKVTLKNGAELNVFKTFKEAAIISIGNKIARKKEKWEEAIEKSYAINNEISELITKLQTLRGD